MVVYNPVALPSFSPISAPVGATVAVTGTRLAGLTALSVNGVSVPLANTSNNTGITITAPGGTSPASTAFTVRLQVLAATLNPLANANAVAVSNSAVVLALSENVTAATAGNVAVFGSLAGGKKLGTVSGGGTATLSFAATTGTTATNFRPGELMSVTVPATVRSAGNIAATPFAYPFTAGGITPSTGTFAGRTDVGGGANVQGLRWADFDADGRLDFVAANQSSNSLTAGRSTGSLGSPSFVTLNAPAVSGSQNYSVAVGDADNDGKPDLAAGTDNGAASVFRNTSGGAGTVAFGLASSFTLSSSGNPRALTWADLDGDGTQDLVAVNYAGNSVSVLRNASSGTGSLSFAGAVTTMLSASNALASALVVTDFNADGKLDMAVPKAAGGLLVLPNTSPAAGTISFGTQLSVSGGVGPGLAVADVDGDGLPDLLGTDYANSQVLVYRNTSTGGLTSFASASPFGLPTGSGPQGLTTGDFNGDGLPFVRNLPYGRAQVYGQQVLLYGVLLLPELGWLLLTANRLGSGLIAAGLLLSVILLLRTLLYRTGQHLPAYLRIVFGLFFFFLLANLFGLTGLLALGSALAAGALLYRYR